MRFELWTDTCAPGTVPAAVAALGAGAAAAAPKRLEALWNTEFGETDQVISLWSIADESGAPAGVDPALPAGLAITRQIRPMQLELPYDREFTGGHIYDFRFYTLRPGARDAFMAEMRAVLPVRKRHSSNVGVWTPLAGNPDQVLHIWAYRDLADRNRARAAAWAEPAWQRYLQAVFPLLVRMQTALLVPAPASPMQ